MVLCIGMIEDNLGRKVHFKNSVHSDNQFVLERCEIYKSRKIFNTGVIYIAKAEDLPDNFTVQDDAALISIGMPPEHILESALQILVLDASTDLIELANDVHQIFFEYNTLEQNLQDAVNKGRSIQYMVNLMAPYLNGNELFVGHPDFRIIGQSNETIHTFEISGLEQPDENGNISSENVSFFKNDIIFNNLRSSTTPFIYEPSIYSCRTVGMNVYRRGEVACRVHICEDVNTFRGYESGLAQFFAAFVQIIYDTTVDANDIMPKNQLEDLLKSLLAGETVEYRELEGSVLKRGWSPSGSFVCAGILPSDRDLYNQTVHFYCETFNRDIDGGCFFEYHGMIVGVISLAGYNGSIEVFNKKNLEIFRFGNFRIGYSNSLTELKNIRHYYLQAEIALKIGLKTNPTQWFHRFSDIVFYYLGSKMTEDLDGRYLCAPEILVLHNYDSKNQTELLKTLQVYIENQMNAIKTANKLYIHRTTMTYRLGRIKELTGLDFKNPAKLLYLAISINFLFKE